VVLPAYGEERRIAGSVDRVRTALNAVGEVELIVVDDGSTDRTSVVAEDAGATVIRLPQNQGKGAAVRAGMLAAEGSTVVFTDADLAYAPAQLIRLVEEVERGWDVVVGSRRGQQGAGLRRTGHDVFNTLTRLVLDRRFADTQCGFKGFHRPAARALFSLARIDRFAFDVEVLWLAGHLGLAIEEIPVELARAEGSTVRLSVDVLQMVGDLLRIRRWAAKGAYG
jgi:glycosyltransferase involved in cell wall biosynthesis